MAWFLMLTALQLSSCQAAAFVGQSTRSLQPEQERSASIKGSVKSIPSAVPNPVVDAPDVTIANILTVTVITKASTTGVAQSLPSSTVHSHTTGTIPTKQGAAGKTTNVPLFPCEEPSSPTTLISSASRKVVKEPTTMDVTSASADIFEAPIASDAPPPSISPRTDHPLPRLGVEQQSAPISTNKFFQNFFLGSQSSATFVHPYSVAWAKGGGQTQSWGLAVSHIDSHQLTLGPENSYGFSSYIINPIGIQSLVLSAVELGPGTSLTTTQITDMSLLVQLRPSTGADPLIQFPLVQGSGFVTAEYIGATPVIETGVFFQSVIKINIQPRPGVTKYEINLNDGKTWYLYALSNNGSSLDLQLINNKLMRSNTVFSGTIQIAKDPGSGQALYDTSCGQYPTGVSLSGTAAGMLGTYKFTFEKAGLTGTPLLMFGLPHHIQSFDETTRAKVDSELRLQTTTKGMATAVVADSWTMVEPRLPVSMSFLPWTETEGSKGQLSDSAKERILQVAQSELSQDISVQTDLNSMYYSGKALLKFAMILSVVHDMLGESALAATGLEKLKEAYALFASNQQIHPLTYESAWGGIVSTVSYETEDAGADFGNTFYNDHHFHFGYHVLAAAIIGHLDSNWLPGNKDYVNSLVRDYANPSSQDTWFPKNRMFDWFHGHSFAHGLFESNDGRDQESSSEDVMSSYAIKMWGLVSGDMNMAARGNLQLAVLARSLNLYFLYSSDNTVAPASFIGNKVAGILFENKIDHTTYFGTNIEHIEGIHMLPLIPATKFVRGAEFAAQEWKQYFSNGGADTVEGAWRGVLYGNLATIDPGAAFTWFNQSDFDSSWLDGGASLTWYLAFSAALAGL